MKQSLSKAKAKAGTASDIIVEHFGLLRSLAMLLACGKPEPHDIESVIGDIVRATREWQIRGNGRGYPRPISGLVLFLTDFAEPSVRRLRDPRNTPCLAITIRQEAFAPTEWISVEASPGAFTDFTALQYDSMERMFSESPFQQLMRFFRSANQRHRYPWEQDTEHIWFGSSIKSFIIERQNNGDTALVTDARSYECTDWGERTGRKIYFPYTPSDYESETYAALCQEA